MKKYISPKAEVIELRSSDVLATSEETTTIAEEDLKGNNYAAVSGLN